jgi:NAD(P)-dependent dehydrogenase (short-subunit alcohol dehydrogenase family)
MLAATLGKEAGVHEKVVIITGSTGIGAAAARLAAARGARLVVASSDEMSCWELAAETGAECWTGDLRSPHSAESILAQCLSRFGRVDGVFNVAGLAGRRFGDGPLHEITDSGWEDALSHNLGIAFRMCRAAVNRMLDQSPAEDGQRGAIVNLGSVLVESPDSRHFATHAYAAAKGAVAAMTRSMAAQYAAQGIRVNAVVPGIVGTPASERTAATQELQDFLRRKQPVSAGTIPAEDIARAALFLLSSDSRAITGELLTVDAGWRLNPG